MGDIARGRPFQCEQVTAHQARGALLEEAGELERQASREALFSSLGTAARGRRPPPRRRCWTSAARTAPDRSPCSFRDVHGLLENLEAAAGRLEQPAEQLRRLDMGLDRGIDRADHLQELGVHIADACSSADTSAESLFSSPKTSVNCAESQSRARSWPRRARSSTDRSRDPRRGLDRPPGERASGLTATPLLRAARAAAAIGREPTCPGPGPALRNPLCARLAVKGRECQRAAVLAAIQAAGTTKIPAMTAVAKPGLGYGPPEQEMDREGPSAAGRLGKGAPRKAPGGVVGVSGAAGFPCPEGIEGPVQEQRSRLRLVLSSTRRWCCSSTTSSSSTSSTTPSRTSPLPVRRAVGLEPLQQLAALGLRRARLPRRHREEGRLLPRDTCPRPGRDCDLLLLLPDLHPRGLPRGFQVLPDFTYVPSCCSPSWPTSSFGRLAVFLGGQRLPRTCSTSSRSCSWRCSSALRSSTPSTASASRNSTSACSTRPTLCCG